jgi:hypothetical protein
MRTRFVVLLSWLLLPAVGAHAGFEEDFQRANRYMQPDTLAYAIDAFRTLATNYADDAHAYWTTQHALGWALNRDGQFIEARRVLMPVTRCNDPNLAADAFIILGMGETEGLENYDKAIEEFTSARAVPGAPDHLRAKAKGWMGFCYVKKGDKREGNRLMANAILEGRCPMADIEFFFYSLDPSAMDDYRAYLDTVLNTVPETLENMNFLNIVRQRRDQPGP